MFLKRVSLLNKDTADYTQYPFTIPVIESFEELELTRNITFFVGENGSGKSTLLKAIAEKCGFNTAGGGRNNTYDVHASNSVSGDYIRLSWMPKITNGFFMRAESFYHFATHIDELQKDGADAYRSYGGRSLHEQSHGESFFSLFQNRFNGRAIYLLDEPEAALSPQRQLAFLRILHDMTVKEGCQFIIATHSPILLGYPEASILTFDEGKIEEIDYKQTDHYQITKYFLDHWEKFLEEILKDEPET
ncbi:AAA family ATPase [Planomicrobium sp. Y74]|uniref:AAA family ATPase n=1 Tax=Planomicrobium sp. Y74 TaxID=2478977 RepID=UPI000EF479E2|nr:AAA family ATPase [Planomicrobium sp. Y74]RLQ83886.1 ATP-binding cassette domain-containing protein [Planomicrobium sp. Y74]